jgi:hypothetical protein
LSGICHKSGRKTTEEKKINVRRHRQTPDRVTLLWDAICLLTAGMEEPGTEGEEERPLARQAQAGQGARHCTPWEPGLSLGDSGLLSSNTQEQRGLAEKDTLALGYFGNQKQR